jgi:hypothetical protein
MYDRSGLGAVVILEALRDETNSHCVSRMAVGTGTLPSAVASTVDHRLKFPSLVENILVLSFKKTLTPGPFHLRRSKLICRPNEYCAS